MLEIHETTKPEGSICQKMELARWNYWCSVMLLNTHLRTGFQAQGEQRRFEWGFIFFHRLFALYLGSDPSPSENSDSWSLAAELWRLLLQNQPVQTRVRTDHVHKGEEYFFWVPLYFFPGIKTTTSVVRLQKGFLFWNICNPFVAETVLLPALPKVFIFPDKWSSLWLALAKDDINFSPSKFSSRDVTAHVLRRIRLSAVTLSML